MIRRELTVTFTAFFVEASLAGDNAGVLLLDWHAGGGTAQTVVSVGTTACLAF